uniref:Uncharacterized protein n=1 Tax=Arundo donax TaxID=35708 RepID=A0A0A9CF57_ARUDO
MGIMTTSGGPGLVLQCHPVFPLPPAGCGGVGSGSGNGRRTQEHVSKQRGGEGESKRASNVEIAGPPYWAAKHRTALKQPLDSRADGQMVGDPSRTAL